MVFDKFEKVNEIIIEAILIFKRIQILKEATDKFQRQMNHYFTQADYQIQHKQIAGYADADYKKTKRRNSSNEKGKLNK